MDARAAAHEIDVAILTTFRDDNSIIGPRPKRRRTRRRLFATSGFSNRGGKFYRSGGPQSNQISMAK
jgi:hypothetical protein